MDLERERAALRILEELLDLPPDERARELDARTADPDLRERVRALLAEETAGALDALELPTGLVGEALARRAADPPSPPELDGYRILGPLGEGGMGRVFLAEQEQPRRRVALKTLRAGLDTEAARRRFRYEAEVLARLRHPGVAQVFATGHYEERGPFGARRVPYIAMEYVEGARDLLSHAAAAGLERADRLRLFLEVCEAVAHAHARGVLHRDLKASNLLVDGDGRVKVIDFGIARASDTTDGATPHTPTRTRGLLGTPSALPPERLTGRTDEADARGDVYALGVVLYELLCGAPPHDLAGLAVHDAARKVLEEPPRRPRRLVDGFPRDLEAVLLRAVEADPGRRYPTVEALARDVERFLAAEPVEARPPGLLHGLALLARRHRLAVGAGAALLLTILAGGGASAVLAVEANRAAADARDARDEQAAAAEEARVAEERALAALDEAEATRRKLIDLSATLVFDFGDRVSRLQGASETRLEALRLGVRHLEELEELLLGDAPAGGVLVRAWLELGDQLGNPTRPNVGDLEGARAAYARAAELLEALTARGFPPDEARLLGGLLALRRGDLANAAGDGAAMEREYAAYLESAREFEAARGLSPTSRHHVARGLSQLGMGRGIRGDHAGAREAFLEARRIRRVQLEGSPEDPGRRAEFAGATAQLGAAEYRCALEADDDPEGLARAVALYAEAVALFDALRSERPDDKWFVRNALETRIPASEVLVRAGDFDAAEGLAGEAVTLVREARALDPGDVDLARFEGLAGYDVGLARRARALATDDPDRRAADLRGAREAFRAALDVFTGLEADGRLLPRERGYLPRIEQELADVDALLEGP